MADLGRRVVGSARMVVDQTPVEPVQRPSDQSSEEPRMALVPSAVVLACLRSQSSEAA